MPIPRSYVSMFSLAVLFSSALAKAGALPAAADDPALREQVRALVRQAGERMDRGDRAGAAEVLEQARRLRADPSLDYNLGIAYSELGQGPEAARAFERFVHAADPARVLPDRIADARRRLDEFGRSLARLRVRISLPVESTEASLYLDDGAAAMPLRGGSPAEPLWLKPGLHRLRVTAPRLHDYQVAVDLGAGESREVTGELYRDEANAGLLRAPPVVSKEPQPFYKKWWFWTAVGVGTATAVGFIAAGAAGAFTHIAPGTDLDAVELAR